MTRPRLLGHRGARARAPENTVASLRRGLADGADGFEFDVRMTADGHAVLLHDDTVDRTTAGTGALREMTLEQARGLDAGAWFDDAHAGERIPTLDEVLDEFLGSAALALEMKETLPASVLRGLAERLHAAPDADFLVGSFQLRALETAREHVPAAPRVLILRRDQPIPDEATRAALGLRGVFARTESVDERFVVDSRRAGLQCYAYTVNDPERAAQLARLGVDGIISDDPGTVRAGLG